MKRDLLSISDLSKDEILQIFQLTDILKKNKDSFQNILAGKSVALIFQKPSVRTRVSFEVGIHQLGGETLYLSGEDMRLGVRECISDVGKVLSRYVQYIIARTFSHEDILKLANSSSCSIINGLTDFLHPCQVLSDIYTIQEKRGNLCQTIAFVGDGNNVAHSWLIGASKMGMRLRMANPQKYRPNEEIVNLSENLAKESGGEIKFFQDPEEAVVGADIIYTDTWVSMGQEEERNKRLKEFKSFQVNKALVELAKDDCMIMHCLPAHRGEEITSDVIDSERSIVFDQAENRLHVQKAILVFLEQRKGENSISKQNRARCKPNPIKRKNF
jgi:ornithine carbamoyltransferase